MLNKNFKPTKNTKCKIQAFFPFIHVVLIVKITCFQKYLLSKIRTFQKYLLSKIPTFKNTYFSKIPTFKNTYFQKYVLFKNTYFQKYVLFKITYFFSEFRTFQKIPLLTKVRLEFPVFPTKIPCFLKIPRSKKLTFYTKFRVFQKKFRVFQNSPVFRFLNILKHTKQVFLYKKIYLQVKKHMFTS